jgi:glycosyltransferase involved in cell wall biosynthesis
MGAAYASADVILNASRSEGLSNVILEAMACGRPVLASDIPGNRQPLCGDTPHEAAGLLFRPEDRDDFRRQALLLLNNPYLRENLGRNGEKRIERFFRPDKEISGLLQAYDFALRNDPIHP